jgi:hypothetical protein
LSQIKPADFFGSNFSSNNKKFRLEPEPSRARLDSITQLIFLKQKQKNKATWPRWKMIGGVKTIRVNTIRGQKRGRTPRPPRCFQIRKKPSTMLTSWSHKHRKNITLANVVVGETVRVIQCEIIYDRCYNESDLVVVEKLNRHKFRFPQDF